MQQIITLLFYNGNQQLYFPNHKFTCQIEDRDGCASTLAAARLMVEQFGNIDIRKTSLNTKNHHGVVNWEAYAQVKDKWTQQNINELKYLRNPYYYVWANFFTQAPLWEIGTHTYYIIELSENDFGMEKFPIPKKKPIIHELQQVIIEGQHLIHRKTILFFNFKDFDSGRFSPPKIYIDTISLFNGLYRRKQERWIVYNVTQGEFPSEEILNVTSAIILPGSASSAYDRKTWINDCQTVIVDIHEQHPNIRMLGVCFGFQLLAQAFGGKVEPMKSRVKYLNYHVFGNEVVTFNENIKKIEYFHDIGESTTINTAHGDVVTVLPNSFQSYGYSKSSTHEIIMSDDQTILGFQSHPEYSTTLLHLLACDFKSQQGKSTFHQNYENAEFTSYFKEQADETALLMCLQFLKH